MLRINELIDSKNSMLIVYLRTYSFARKFLHMADILLFTYKRKMIYLELPTRIQTYIEKRNLHILVLILLLL